jgi:Smg protein
MTTGSVLDILIFVFDRYMLATTPAVPDRARLAQDLQRAGFGRANVERALDWLTELAFGPERTALVPRSGTAATGMRVFTDSELARLSAECRGLLLGLEQAQIITPSQRELVIERLLALEAEELDAGLLKWVVLIVLSSQPGQELALERLTELVADDRGHAPH